MPKTLRQGLVALACLLPLLAVVLIYYLSGGGKESPALPKPSTAVTQKPESVATSVPDPGNIKPSISEADFEEPLIQFEEAFRLPASDLRNQKLRAITTDDGYRMVYQDPSVKSNADIAAAGQIPKAMRGASLKVDIYLLDENTVSITSQIPVEMYKDGVPVSTPQTETRLTSWVRQNGRWLLAAIQFETS